MIAMAGPALPAAEAARRAGRRHLPCWMVSPGADDVLVQREFVACDPVRVVRGSSVQDLESAWVQEQFTWRAERGVPIGIGWISYRATPGFPAIEFRFYDALWVNDVAWPKPQIWAVDGSAANRLAAALADGDDEEEWLPGNGAPLEILGPLVPTEPPGQHLAAIEKVLAYLRAGDAYQVSLARRLVAPLATTREPTGWALFARLQDQSPAPHAVWLADAQAGTCIVGNSPERFLRLDGQGAIETQPIKGTRARAEAPEELLRDAKERAEHIMIVDLERNDLGRICRPGSIEVQVLMRVMPLPTVHHLVSTVRGRLVPGVGLAGILAATFPGGSVTGAPKIRAMQIIDELEPAPRGPYTGATGWLGAAGDLDLAVAIRTATVKDGQLCLWVGGGIVADSTPERELRETEIKAAAFSRLGRMG